MKESFVPVNEPLLDGNELRYLGQCIDTGWISSEGSYVREFEERMAARVGRKHAISVTNGTAAIDLAIEALGLGPGDEVILPTFTIISCIAGIIRAGAKPILVDADAATWNMDVAQVASKITAKTKAILVVHTYGLPVDMDPLIELADRHGLVLIEDAAEAHGLMYRNKACGSFGAVSTFSFYANKHVTTGEGGMVVTDDDLLADACRSLRNLCFQPNRRFIHDRLGWNLRMTNVQAAIGVAQLERLDRFLEIKRSMGARYTSLLRGIDGLQLPVEKTAYADNHYWVYGVVLDEHLNVDSQLAMKFLTTKGVGTRPFFWPMHEQPVLRNMGLFAGEKYPVSERIARKGFYLPSGMALTDTQILQAAESVKDFFASL